MMWAAEFKNKPYQDEIKKHYDQGIYIENKYDFQKSKSEESHGGHGHH